MEKLLKKIRIESTPKHGNRLFLLLIIPLVIYFSFGFYHLTKFETVDEHYWMYSNTNNNNYWTENNGRIKQYWDALLRSDWVKTRINDKPGITLAYVAGVGSWLKTNLDYHVKSGAVPTMNKSDKAEKINLFFRLPILIFNGLFSLVLFFLIRKLTDNDWIALFSATFTLLSPIIIGISQIVNPDALLWEFGFASILSFLIYLKTGLKKYVGFAALFIGLSLLSKYSSVIFLPFLFAVMLAYIIENASSWEIGGVARKIKTYTIAYFLIIAGALAVYAILLPDNLVELRHFMKGSLGFKGMQPFFVVLFGANFLILLDAIFRKSAGMKWLSQKFLIIEKYFKLALFCSLPVIFAIVIINAFFGRDWLLLFVTPFDAANKTIFRLPAYRIFLKQFMPLAFSLSPIVLFLLIYAWIKNFRQTGKYQWIVFVFSFFILVLVAASMQQKMLLTIRYSVMLYPMIFTLAAIGIWQLLKLGERTNFFRFGVFGIIIIISIFSLWRVKPFYFNYMNSLLPQKFLITDAWGYGGYEAAQYLNNLQGAEHMRVWSDYNGVCLFFNGRCEANSLTLKNALKKSAGIPQYDYFVSNRRGRLLSQKTWLSLENDYTIQLIQDSYINNRPDNFIKIYKVTAHERIYQEN